MPTKKQEETPVETGPAELEELTVDTADAHAVVTVNGQKFAFTPNDVYHAKRAFERAYFELN